MTESENILARIREALKSQAQLPGSHNGNPESPAGPRPTIPALRQWLPAVGESRAELLACFQNNAALLKAEFHLLKDQEEFAARLVQLCQGEQWQKVGAHGGELTEFACKRLGLPVCWTDRTYDVKELEACGAGLTQCDALVAQTGSVLVTSRSAGGRALSVLPPHHVVLARSPQLVRDLPEAFALLKQRYAPNYPSFISFITGPSRTGDIERILVLGAHGPKKLTILCLE